MCEHVYPPLCDFDESFKDCSLKESYRCNTVAGEDLSPRQAVRGWLGAEIGRPAAGGAVEARAHRDKEAEFQHQGREGGALAHV